MFTLIVSGVSCFLMLWLAWGLRRWIPEWWRQRTVRLFVTVWIGMTFTAAGLYLGGIEMGSFEIYQVGKMLWALSIIVSAPLAAVLTLCFIVVARKHARAGSEDASSEAMTSRRTFLRWAMIPPVISGTASFSGLIRAQSNASIHRVELTFPQLPQSLDGLTILHVTDAHLGPFIEVNSFDETVEALQDTSIDIIAITGDFADHLRLMKPAIERLEKLNPTYGLFFSMGNHEYYHPEGKVLEQLAALNIRTLVGAGVSVKAKDATLFIAGADDPARNEDEEEPFLRTSIEKALSTRPEKAFTILLSHRPAGFNAAQELDVDLTLAGDTHGYQLGVFGRSPLHVLFGEEYPRGHYRRGTSQLYTSTGYGHWFPFRLGCDREAALLTLRRDKT